MVELWVANQKLGQIQQGYNTVARTVATPSGLTKGLWYIHCLDVNDHEVITLRVTRNPTLTLYNDQGQPM